jgi:hypothetical protein
MQVTKQLGSASGHPISFFGCCDKRPSSGEWLIADSASLKKYDTPATAMRLRHSAVWNVAEMTLKINLYELTAHHLNAAFWKQRMETQGNSLRFWNTKCIKQVKELFRSEICYFLGGKISYAGMY